MLDFCKGRYPTISEPNRLVKIALIYVFGLPYYLLIMSPIFSIDGIDRCHGSVYPRYWLAPSFWHHLPFGPDLDLRPERVQSSSCLVCGMVLLAFDANLARYCLASRLSSNGEWAVILGNLPFAWGLIWEPCDFLLDRYFKWVTQGVFIGFQYCWIFGEFGTGNSFQLWRDNYLNCYCGLTIRSSLCRLCV